MKIIITVIYICQLNEIKSPLFINVLLSADNCRGDLNYHPQKYVFFDLVIKWGEDKSRI